MTENEIEFGKKQDILNKFAGDINIEECLEVAKNFTLGLWVKALAKGEDADHSCNWLVGC
jgi:hypothetical protein